MTCEDMEDECSLSSVFMQILQERCIGIVALLQSTVLYFDYVFIEHVVLPLHYKPRIIAVLLGVLDVGIGLTV